MEINEIQRTSITKTYRKTEGGGRTQVGAADIYEPRCLKHWEAR